MRYVRDSDSHGGDLVVYHTDPNCPQFPADAKPYFGGRNLRECSSCKGKQYHELLEELDA